MRRHLTLLAAGLVWWTARVHAPVTLHLIGDSTMADKPDPSHNPERGWGQALPEFAIGETAVRNYAMNGRSTRSFIAEGRWATVRAALQPGDYVLIQFGHNDEKVADSLRYTDPATSYRANLARFVTEARAAGAIPILFTPIVRRQWTAGALVDTHGSYPAAVREVARAMQVPLIDHEALTRDLVRSAGDSASRAWYVFTQAGEFPAFPAARQDNTHLSPAGARIVARAAVGALLVAIPALSAHLKLPASF